ncbi:MAG: dihydrolipoyl dehydrogenase [Vulcanimicrobiota bacterium]
MTSSNEYDVIILGGGPGGYVAAIRAAQLQLKTLLIEKDKLGGTCLHRGCIPTKALLHYTETIEKLAHCADFGINAGAVESIDMEKMHGAKGKVVKRMTAGIDGLMKKNEITVVSGHGRLVAERTVEVDDEKYKGRHVILATGSKPAALPFLKPDGKRVFTSDEILTYERIPKSMVVLGAGAVGLEFACVYNALGTKVQVVEMAERPLPLEDEAISKELQRVYKKRGIPIHCSVKLERAEVGKKSVKLQGKNLLKDSEVSFEPEVVLTAVGRLPVLDEVGLEKFKVEMEGRFVRVDEFYRTRLSWLYAIGDVIPGPQLAHVASAEGIVCVEQIAGHPTHPLDYDKIPSATYCRPEVASVGLTEAQAKERGYEVSIGEFPWAALGKASILGETDGKVKIVADNKYGELLGVHIVGPHATDLIAEACVALQCEATVEELYRTVHAHPTLPEGLMEAAHGVFGQPIHLPPQRKRRAK